MNFTSMLAETSCFGNKEKMIYIFHSFKIFFFIGLFEFMLNDPASIPFHTLQRRNTTTPSQVPSILSDKEVTRGYLVKKR